MANKLVSADLYEKFHKENSNKPGIMNNYLSYYLMPIPYNQTDFFWMQDSESQLNLKHLQTCALSQVFISNLALNSSYTKAVPSEAYIGFNRSGLFCDWTSSSRSFFTQPLDTRGYECPSSMVSPKIKSQWSSSYYSPLCRTWFKGQKEGSLSSYVTSPY